MLFKGTERRSAQQIADEIDSVGGDINAFTSKEHTCYYVRVLMEDIGLGLDILSDMFLHSVLDPEELVREENVILEEIKRRDDEPDDLVHDLLAETLWPNHVLGKSVIGTPETVSSFTSDDLRKYMARYTPDTIVIAASGNLDHDVVVAHVAEHFGRLTGKRDDWRVADTVPEFSPGKIIVEKPVEQVTLVLGTPGYSQIDDNRYRLSILDNVVGGSMSSRLFQEIREKRGLAYSVGSYYQTFREGGYFGVYAGTSAQTADEVIDLMKSEINKIRTENITDQELVRSKNQFRGSIVMGLEGMNSRMMRIGRSELSHDRVIPIDEVLAKINEVTLEHIAEAADYAFGSGEFAMATVGPHAFDYSQGEQCK
jgi:predicted Zn-dependent peptidase